MDFSDVSMQSNLQRLLDCTTPSVPSQFQSKSEMRKLNRLWNPWEGEKVEYFSLSDLWNSYDEWSAYGAGVPIRLSNGQKLVQYYVPYLSAIQIFTSSSSKNYLREETASACETRDSFSDSFSDENESESDKLLAWDGCSSEEGLLEQDGFTNDRLGYRNFEYIERSSPYARVPLLDKISSLGRRYPRLMSLRSVDLSPASWMAVAWYPIYPIPMGRSHKDLSTCFLTFHTLSSSFQDVECQDNPAISTGRKKRNEGERIPLPPFGLATHKLLGNIWFSDNSRDRERVVSLFNVADSWLKQLSADHHDFKYFAARRC